MPDSESTEALYVSIAQEIIASINEAWTKAWLDVLVVPGCVTVSNFYVSSSGSQNVRQFQEKNDIFFDAFEQLQSLMQQDGKPTWNRAKFTLYPDGKFDIDFSWDQEIVDKIDRLAKEPDSRFDR